MPRVGKVAGCFVRNGTITRGSKVRFLREGVVIWNGAIASLRRFKDDVREVQSGFECGIGLENYQDLKPGDVIETYEGAARSPAPRSVDRASATRRCHGDVLDRRLAFSSRSMSPGRHGVAQQNDCARCRCSSDSGTSRWRWSIVAKNAVDEAAGECRRGLRAVPDVGARPRTRTRGRCRRASRRREDLAADGSRRTPTRAVAAIAIIGDEHVPRAWGCRTRTRAIERGDREGRADALREALRRCRARASARRAPSA